MKYFRYVVLSLVLLFVFYLRYMAIHDGLPYLHHYDEPYLATAALNVLKTGSVTPRYSENCYGGFMRYTCTFVDYLHFQYLKSRPEYFLDSFAQIKTNLDGDFRTISFPSFYFWNRLYLALISTAGVWLCYVLGKKFRNGLTGILAALILALSYHYLDHSKFTTVDVPMTFWAVLTVIFALQFNQTKKFSFLSLSLFTGGMAIATKLSGAITLIIPFTAFLLNFRTWWAIQSVMKRWIILFAWGLIPFALFLLWNPNIFTDTASYLEWNKWIMETYKTGGGHFSKEPGWEHFSFQMEVIEQDISPYLFRLAWVGLLLAFISVRVDKNGKLAGAGLNKNGNALIVLVFPMVYMLYMSQQRVAYHRNFVVMYPFFSLLAAYSISWFSSLIGALIPYKLKPVQCIVVTSVLLLTFVYVFKDKYTSLYQTAHTIYTSRETRTQAVEAVNQLIEANNGKGIVGIARELKMSDEDLRRIKYPYRIFEHQFIPDAAQKSTFLLVGNYRSIQEGLHRQDDSLNSLTPDSVVQTIGGSPLYRDGDVVLSQIPHVNPQVNIVKGASFEEASKYTIPLYELLERVVMFSNNEIVSDSIRFEPGKYSLYLEGYGTPAANEYPHLKIKVGRKTIAEYTITPDKNVRNFFFKVTKLQRAKIRVQYDNDFATGTEDRNAVVQKLIIAKRFE
jgi:hypothetical protein